MTEKFHKLLVYLRGKSKFHRPIITFWYPSSGNDLKFLDCLLTQNNIPNSGLILMNDLCDQKLDFTTSIFEVIKSEIIEIPSFGLNCPVNLTWIVNHNNDKHYYILFIKESNIKIFNLLKNKRPFKVQNILLRLYDDFGSYGLSLEDLLQNHRAIGDNLNVFYDGKGPFWWFEKNEYFERMADYGLIYTNNRELYDQHHSVPKENNLFHFKSQTNESCYRNNC